MHRNIHDVIDGMLVRGMLSAEQRAEVAALEATIEATTRPLLSSSVPDFTDRVMARLGVRASEAPAERTSVVRRLVAALWSPRPVTIRLRPAYVLGTVAAIAVATVAMSVPPPGSGAGEPMSSAIDPAVPLVYVQFRLHAEGADRVALAGSFSGWKPAHEMRETAPGTWSILLPLEPGIHDYAFIVDGDRWIADPHALQVDDGFGGANSRIALPSFPASLLRS